MCAAWLQDIHSTQSRFVFYPDYIYIFFSECFDLLLLVVSCCLFYMCHGRLSQWTLNQRRQWIVCYDVEAVVVTSTGAQRPLHLIMLCNFSPGRWVYGTCQVYSMSLLIHQNPRLSNAYLVNDT